MKYRETDEDRDVKRQVWGAVVREATRFASRFNEERVAGERYSDGQKDVMFAARRRGYTADLIRALAAHMRKPDDLRRDRALRWYRVKIGL